MAIGDVQVKRWNRDEYYRLAEAGLLEGKRAELIQGEIYMMSPQGPRHSATVAIIVRLMRAAMEPKYYVMMQQPLTLEDYSEPEPDVAVVPGQAEDYLQVHPTSALLVIEVSDSSLQHDRQTKSSLYSQAGIQEYWLVDLIARQVEVRTQPGESGYGRIETYRSGESIAPLMAPEQSIAVADILP